MSYVVCERRLCCVLCVFFFFNDTATTEIYTLSLHDALPIWDKMHFASHLRTQRLGEFTIGSRSEEHTSELQSPYDLVCRLLPEKTKQRRCTRRPLAYQSSRTRSSLSSKKP